MIRTAVYGGTFDPPHSGHLMVARAALDAGLADEVWMLPSPLNPLKKGNEISAEETRLEMVRLAVAGEKGIVASDFEFHLPSPSYSIRTLRALKETFPDRQFMMLVGGDNLANFHLWREHDAILAEFGLVVYPRPGEEIPAGLTHHPGVCLIPPTALSPVSSSEIRSRVAQGLSIEGMVAPAVERFILDNHLYR